MPGSKERLYRLRWRTEQIHTRTFTAGELQQLAVWGHQISFGTDGEPDLSAFEVPTGLAGPGTLAAEWSSLDWVDEVDGYGRVLDHGQPADTREVTWRITAADRTAGEPASAHMIAGTPGAAVAMLRHACEIMRARRRELGAGHRPDANR